MVKSLINILPSPLLSLYITLIFNFVFAIIASIPSLISYSIRMITDKNRANGSLADPHLLDKIDKLFACNVGEYIDLPQLVVIGDQSSGKVSQIHNTSN